MNGSASDHFLWKEFYCNSSGCLLLSDLTLFHVDLLEKLRVQYGNPLKVNSGYRSPQHNKKIGGAKNSMHLRFATDIAPTGEVTMEKLDSIAGLAEENGFSGIGRYDSFVHLDCRDFIDRSPARWDNRSS